MAKGTIIVAKTGPTGTIRSDDGKEYRFNRKRIAQGSIDQVQQGRRVEFQPDGEWATQIVLLDEVQEQPRQTQVPKHEAAQEYSPQPRVSGQKRGGASAQRPMPEKATAKGDRFLNPYNFVRVINQSRPQNHVLGDCPPPPHDRYVGLTGRITCQVEAVTPLFISDSHAVEGTVGEHRTYRFFQWMGSRPCRPAACAGWYARSLRR